MKTLRRCIGKNECNVLEARKSDVSERVRFAHTDRRLFYILPSVFAAIVFSILARISSRSGECLVFAFFAFVSAGLCVSALRKSRTWWNVEGRRLVWSKGTVQLLAGVSSVRVVTNEFTDITLDFSDGSKSIWIEAPYERRGRLGLVEALETATGVVADWPGRTEAGRKGR